MRLYLKSSGKNVLSKRIGCRKASALRFRFNAGLPCGHGVGQLFPYGELLNSQAFVERTNSVLHEMDGVEDGLQDAREAALHYVLTPEKEDLVTFDDAVAQTWTRLDRIADK